MSDQWYIARNNKKHGPFTAAKLKELASQGQVLPTDMVWKEGMQKWVVATTVKGLFAAGGSAVSTAQAADPTSSKPPRKGKLSTFLKCLAGPVLKFVVKTAGNAAGGGVIPFGDIAVEVWEGYSKQCTEPEMRAEIEQIAQDHALFRQQVAQWIEENAANQEALVREQLANYLSQVPGQIQRSLQRAEDPSGRTLPPSLQLRKAQDLKQFVPERMPRFKSGDRPVTGTDLVVQELIGVGGFGEVWRAIHASRPHAQPVALKFCTDNSAAKSLVKEVELLDRVASKGRHPNIVELRYVHLNSTPPCLEYEYVDGGDMVALISDLHRTRRATPDQVARLMFQIASAVGFAHRQKPPIVHRDLKPGNVLVQKGKGGMIHLKVADFGIGGIASEQTIAHWSSATSSMSDATTSRGVCTPLYASPQQRKNGPPDPRDDVYALGVIWYQLLTGDVTKEPPRGGGWKKRLVEQGVSPAMVSLIEQCLEDDVEERPGDAQELADHLKKLGSSPSADAPIRSQELTADSPFPEVEGQLRLIQALRSGIERVSPEVSLSDVSAALKEIPQQVKELSDTFLAAEIHAKRVNTKVIHNLSVLVKEANLRAQMLAKQSVPSRSFLLPLLAVGAGLTIVGIAVMLAGIKEVGLLAMIGVLFDVCVIIYHASERYAHSENQRIVRSIEQTFARYVRS